MKLIKAIIRPNKVDDLKEAIREAARTGEIGDGRVFTCSVEQAYNIRTGERDFA